MTGVILVMAAQYKGCSSEDENGVASEVELTLRTANGDISTRDAGKIMETWLNTYR